MNWKRQLRCAGGNPVALNAHSRAPPRHHTGTTPAPHRHRKSYSAQPLAAQIRKLRTRYPNLGEAKLHALLSPWCEQHRIP